MDLRLRFPLAEVGYWADRYQYADDAEVEQIGKGAGRAGCYTLDDLRIVARWKTRGRSARHIEMNTDADVRSATAFALTISDEPGRVDALVRLHGVQLPTASVLLHLALPNQFPIIDYRALWSLGIEDAPAAYSFDFWWAYVEVCRSLRTDARVDMRRLDRGLWQYSKEHQPSTTRGARTTAPTSGPVAAKDVGASRTRLPTTDARPLSRRSAAASLSAGDGTGLESPQRSSHERWAAMGSVERAIRMKFTGGEVLHTLDRAKPFTIQLDGRGITLTLGQNTQVPLSWGFLESIPAFLRQRGGWVKAGGIHSTEGEPGTLDEYCKQASKTDVARWLVVVLLKAKLVDVRERPALSIRLGTGQVEAPPEARPEVPEKRPVFSTPTCPHGMLTSDCYFCSRRFRR